MTSFPWVPLYRELAGKLLPFEQRQAELLGILRELRDSGLKVITLDDQDETGRTVPLAEIDPFSFFASFNRGITRDQRREIISGLKQRFSLQSDVPETFEAIPIVHNMNSWFIHYAGEREPEDVGSLWKLARQATEGGRSAIDAALFDRCAQRIGIGKITVGLFWIRPDEFLPCDKRTRAYLKSHGIEEKATNFATYKELSEIAPAQLGLSFLEISSRAYHGDHRYWAGGFLWGGTDSMLEKFVGGSYWQIGWEKDTDNAHGKRHWALLAEVRPGDLFAIKGYGGTHHLNVHFIGEVQSVDLDTGRVELQRLDRPLYHGEAPRGQGAGPWRETLLEVTRSDVIRLLFEGGSSATDDFLSVMHRYLDENVVYQSPVQGHRYRVEAVDDLSCRIARLDANEPLKVTLDAYLRAIEQATKGGGRIEKSHLSTTVAAQAALVQGKSLFLPAGEQAARLVRDNFDAEVVLIDAVKKLRVDESGDVPRRYKPAALLCVLDGIEAGELESNQVRYDWFEPRLVKFLKEQGIEASAQQAAYVFYHLTSELFWMLSYQDPARPVQEPPSPAKIREHIRYATIKDRFWDLLQDSAARSRVRAAILARWFRSEPHLLTLEWLERETLWDTPRLNEIVEALRTSSPQVVLAGPPGTGKTWVAKAIARYVTRDQSERWRLVQFHPSYGYEEFIEGLRPVSRDGGIHFELTPGVVLSIAERVRGDDDPFVLIIDEMNRANLPRVFGELMYLFEYRDEAIDLQYSPDFKLPRCVKFIGTMNTADRSIRSIDIALRRRFEIFECAPSTAVLERYYQTRTNEITNLIEGFEKLNRELTADLDRHHTVGHTFFMSEKMTRDRLRETWDRKIGPLIEEYFFDQPDLAAKYQLDAFWPGA